MSPEVEAFWLAFCAASGTAPDTPHDVWTFGDSPEQSDELLALVLHGPKRATAGPVSPDEPLPVVGGLGVVCDGHGQPGGVVRTTEVRVGPLESVDDAFAWDEGEGDRTRAYWLEVHRAYTIRVLAARGEEFHEDQPVVFERFELLWP